MNLAAGTRVGGRALLSADLDAGPGAAAAAARAVLARVAAAACAADPVSVDDGAHDVSTSAAAAGVASGLPGASEEALDVRVACGQLTCAALVVGVELEVPAGFSAVPWVASLTVVTGLVELGPRAKGGAEARAPVAPGDVRAAGGPLSSAG